MSVSFDNCYKSVDGILSTSIYFTSLNYIPTRYIFCIEFPQTHFFGSGATRLVVSVIGGSFELKRLRMLGFNCKVNANRL